MKKTLLLLILGIFASTLRLFAADLPKVSQGDNVTWYVLQFVQGSYAVTDQGEGAICLTGSFKNSDSQIWKIEGDATNGYTFTNKAGRKLYVDAASKSSGTSGFFYAGASPASNDKFALVATADTANWLIAPQANQEIFMNQYQGSKVGQKCGLWTGKDDAGSAIKFTEVVASDGISLIPYPKSLTKGEGTLDIKTLTAITYAGETNQALATSFADQLKATSGITLTVKESGSAHEKGTISLIVDESLADEGYTLTANAEGVAITAKAHAGFFYALQTLKQLLPTAYFGSTLQSEAGWVIPYIIIQDQPELSYRGFQLDVARHFFNKEEVKRVLDIMSFYKLNRFHWHLTDDQGWRVEIPEYPKLTTVGSIRSGSKANNSGFFDDTTYGEGMWYSLDDLKEIVAYAKERGIEIMPEIDLPGHMVAAVAAYPELGCNPDKQCEVRVNSGISQDVLNIGKDETIDFLKCVLGHIADVFPYEYIHLGGDECPTTQWASNADCLKRVEDEGLSGVSELQSWLVEKLGVWLRDEKGKSVVGWDEIMQNWHESNTIEPTIMQWNIGETKEQVANTIAKGFKSIMVPYQTLYLDFYQVSTSERRVDEGYDGGWGDGWVNSLDEIYDYNPLSKFTDANRNLCLGVQGNMWTETCNKNSELEYQMLPRIMALAEIGWLPNGQKNWISFLTRLQQHAAILDSLSYNYAKHFFFDNRTDSEIAIDEAEEILTAATPGAAGYASVEAYAALQAALDAAKAAPTDETKATALTTAIATLKAADIVQPTEGKPYQIVSASTYYKNCYDGSTMYEKSGTVRFHYTPQAEPEELWTFVKNGDGYNLTSYGTGNTIALPTYNANATSTASSATALRVDKATVKGTMTGCKDFIPGVVTLSAVSGYAAAATGNVNRLYANSDGYVKSYNDPTLQYQGTWRLIEITDFTEQLQGLVKKAERIVNAGTTGGYNEPTEEAIEFLNTNVVTPAKATLEAGVVSEESYKSYVALYEEYLAMPRKQLYDVLSEDSLYTISIVYSAWSSYYAKANGTSVAPGQPTDVKTQSEYQWYVKKLGDGKVKIYNYSTRQPAYVSSFAQAQDVKLGTEAQATEWLLSYNETTDASGICIGDTDGSGGLSWYNNPTVQQTVRLMPRDYGASMWTFNVIPGLKVGIGAVVVNDAAELPVRYYDLAGRQISKPQSGLYITNQGGKLLIK